MTRDNDRHRETDKRVRERQTQNVGQGHTVCSARREDSETFTKRAVFLWDSLRTKSFPQADPANSGILPWPRWWRNRKRGWNAKGQAGRREGGKQRDGERQGSGGKARGCEGLWVCWTLSPCPSGQGNLGDTFMSSSLPDKAPKSWISYADASSNWLPATDLEQSQEPLPALTHSVIKIILSWCHIMGKEAGTWLAHSHPGSEWDSNPAIWPQILSSQPQHNTIKASYIITHS